MDRTVLFKTVHGSRLYGLNHAGSDEDFYTVVTKTPVDNRFGRQTRSKYAKQTITGSEDSFVVDLGTWMEMCKSGVPQALEAMFSNMAIVDEIPNLRASFRAGPRVTIKYLDTIKSFALAEDESRKKRRHALRLALNLRELCETGRFNPTLSTEDANWITSMSSKTHEDVYGLALVTAWAPL